MNVHKSKLIGKSPTPTSGCNYFTVDFGTAASQLDLGLPSYPFKRKTNIIPKMEKTLVLITFNNFHKAVVIEPLWEHIHGFQSLCFL